VALCEVGKMRLALPCCPINTRRIKGFEGCCKLESNTFLASTRASKNDSALRTSTFAPRSSEDEVEIACAVIARAEVKRIVLRTVQRRITPRYPIFEARVTYFTHGSKATRATWVARDRIKENASRSSLFNKFWLKVQESNLYCLCIRQVS
jgi:hypothetical protein